MSVALPNPDLRDEEYSIYSPIDFIIRSTPSRVLRNLMLKDTSPPIFSFEFQR